MLHILLTLLHVIDIALPVAMAVLYFTRIFEFKRSVLGYAITCVGGIICVAALNLHPWQRELRLLLFLFVFLAAACFFMHGSFAKKLYHTLQFTFSYIICEYGFALTVEWVKSRYDVGSIEDALVSLAEYLIFSLLVYLLFIIQLHFFLVKAKDMTTQQYILMSPMLLMLLILIVMSIRMNNYVYNMTFFLLSMVMNLCILWLYRNLKQTSDQIAKSRFLMKERTFYQEQLAGQKEVRRLRHDMKNMLLGIRADLDLEEYDRAKKAMDKIVDDIGATDRYVSGTVVLDAVLAPKFARIREEGIPLRHHIHIQEEEKLQNVSVDLSVILGNLLDNALEGTVLLPKEDERLIELSIQQDGDTLTILVANTSHPVVISKEKAQPSTKEAGRAGIGMESIRERCATLHGYSHFQWKDGMFEAMVQISLS